MENNIGKYALGVGAGYLSYKGTLKLVPKLIKPYSNEVITRIKDLSQSQSETIQKAIYQGHVQSGLKAKKIYIHNVTPDNVDHMTQLMEKKIDKIITNSLVQKLKSKNIPLTPKGKKELAKNLTEHLKNRNYKKAWQEIRKAYKGKPIETCSTDKFHNSQILPNNSFKKIIKIVGDGKNAFFNRHTRDIMVNFEKLGGTTFHEMGHALNATGSKITKSLHFGRFAPKLFIPAILAIGLLKSKKKDEQKPNGIIDKTTTFIKNNAGKLTFATFSVVMLEEGLASIRGRKIAKKVLDPKLLKQVNKLNFLAWTTYLLSALALTSATTLAVKVRDKIAQT